MFVCILSLVFFTCLYSYVLLPILSHMFFRVLILTGWGRFCDWSHVRIPIFNPMFFFLFLLSIILLHLLYFLFLSSYSYSYFYIFPIIPISFKAGSATPTFDNIWAL